LATILSNFSPSIPMNRRRQVERLALLENRSVEARDCQVVLHRV
jgi:hypothetical protein